MDKRFVTHVHTEHGAIADLYGMEIRNLQEKRWGPVTKATAIDEIERGIRKYYVWDRPVPNLIGVIHSMYGPYLRTPPNPQLNLEDLPEPPTDLGQRIVTRIHRVNGVIEELYGRDWGPCAKAAVIDEIENWKREYVVSDPPVTNPILVVHRGGYDNYLRTPPNPRKNLGQLEEAVH